jgi:hypothetical protein
MGGQDDSGALIRWAGRDAEFAQHIKDGIADHAHALGGNPFGAEESGGKLGRGQVQRCCGGRDSSVHLFNRGLVEGTQASLEVGNRYSRTASGQTEAGNRVGIAKHQDQIRTKGNDQLQGVGKHGPQPLRSRAVQLAHPIGSYSELVVEDIGHLGVVMLAGCRDGHIDPSRP